MNNITAENAKKVLGKVLRGWKMWGRCDGNSHTQDEVEESLSYALTLFEKESEWSQDIARWMDKAHEAEEENRMLSADNDCYKQDRITLREMQEENARLKEACGVERLEAVLEANDVSMEWLEHIHNSGSYEKENKEYIRSLAKAINKAILGEK